MASNQINDEYIQKGYLKAYLANRGIKCVSYDEWEHLCDCIDDAKAADVVEVVRCGDCKYKDDGIDEDGFPFLKCLSGRSYGGTRINDFCSWGERRTDGEEVH